MKKLFGMFTCLLVTLLCIVASCTVTSCDNLQDAKNALSKSQVDTAFVKECVYSVVTPEFTTIDEVLLCQQKLNNNAYVDSMFMSLPENLLKNVATVLLKKTGRATKKAIVNEYISNKDIYKNLPIQPGEQETETTLVPLKQQNSTPTVVEELQPGGKGKVASTSYQVKDTTIDGKKADIVTKTTVYE